ncbi:proline-rich protein HaeIII subfamily 1-like [Peromyscus californicus insignis]|uniref:proline-rich protein HaeIII subfamily 1-like n=1 Tax=Peromyscus californicus insignis TaxID=564181 RepID=UPI0022A69835|nr:proline-rich protein HaeIII subfamily 1-like [Peromyscus californicus insignis]
MAGMALNITTLENNSRASSKMLAVLFTAALLVLSSAQSPDGDPESQSTVPVASAAPEAENDPQSDSPPGEEQVSSDAVENEVNNPQQEQSAEGLQHQSSTLPEDSQGPVQQEGQQHDFPPPEFQHRPPPRGPFSGNKRNPSHIGHGKQRPPLGRGKNGMALNVTTLENNSSASSKMLAVLFTAALLVLSSAQSPNGDPESQSTVPVASAAPEAENDPQSDSPPGEEQVSSDAVENEVNNPQQEQSAEGLQHQSSTLPEDSQGPVQQEGQQHDFPPPEFQHRPPPRGPFSGNKRNPSHIGHGKQRPPLGRGKNVKKPPHHFSLRQHP